MEMSSLVGLKRLFRRIHDAVREPEQENFFFQELQDGKWPNVIVPQGEEPPKWRCEEFFCPGRTYRLIARSLETGHIRTLWVHHERDYGPIKFK